MLTVQAGRCDHLGSANWITDYTGAPIQYIHYAPYGELIDNQVPYGYDERYKFTGKELLGTWSEPYHVDIMVKTMTFNDDGTLTYTNRPDTTWNVVIDYAGEFAQLRYTAKNHQLHISGERKYYDNTIGKMAYEPFTFSTGYSIEGNVLTLDSFSYDGGYSKYYKPVILYKQ